MLFTSGKSEHTHLTQSVFEFFTTKYGIDSDVEVYHTDLSDDNAFGFTEVNGDEQFIQENFMDIPGVANAYNQKNSEYMRQQAIANQQSRSDILSTIPIGG